MLFTHTSGLEYHPAAQESLRANGIAGVNLMQPQTSVMVCGIGGASLGTEIIKALALAGSYTIYGCDISPQAYGHSMVDLTEQTFVVDRDSYVRSVIDACRSSNVRYVIPGGEQPMVLLGQAAEQLESEGLVLVGNEQPVITRFSDKAETFVALGELGLPIPRTIEATDRADLEDFVFPAIVKPATDSGGSSFVFLTRDLDEAALYVEHLKQNNRRAVVQEYIPHDEGEFTIGVLSLPDGQVISSVALKRLFHTKLSVQFRGEGGLISSGYSQGLIDDFPDLREQAEAIARGINSRGPINVQARLRDGVLYPFEINPRFSASTYLRALAGINEVDLFLRHLINGTTPEVKNIKPGYYLRTLDETMIPLSGASE